MIFTTKIDELVTDMHPLLFALPLGITAAIFTSGLTLALIELLLFSLVLGYLMRTQKTM